MAGKPKPMSQIKQLLLLHQQGKGQKTIARTLGMSKNTVKEYLRKLKAIISNSKDTPDIVLVCNEDGREARLYR